MVGTTLNKETYAITSASTGAMDIPFRYDDNSWIYAVAFLGESETTTTLVLGSDFTLAGDGTQSLGEITLSESFLENLVPSTLVVYRIAPALQTLDLQLNTRLPAEALEAALDRLAMASIDRSNISQRTFTLPFSDPESFAPSYAIEGANERKGTVMAFATIDGKPVRLTYAEIAPLILQYYGLEITSEDILAAISAIAPIEIFDVPDINTPGKFGQLAIIGELVDLVIGGTLSPEINGTLLPWKVENGKRWFSTSGQDPLTDGLAESVLVSWSGSSWAILRFIDGEAQNTVWISFPGSWNDRPYPDQVGTWFVLGGATGQPDIGVTNRRDSRAWINRSPGGSPNNAVPPNWGEVKFIEQIDRFPQGIVAPIWLRAAFDNANRISIQASDDLQTWRVLSEWTATNTANARDPQLLFQANRWWMVYGNGGFDPTDSFSLAVSDDLLNWEFVTEISCAPYVPGGGKVWQPILAHDENGRVYCVIVNINEGYLFLRPTDETDLSTLVVVANTPLLDIIAQSAFYQDGTYYIVGNHDGGVSHDYYTAPAAEGPYEFQGSIDTVGGDAIGVAYDSGTWYAFLDGPEGTTENGIIAYQTSSSLSGSFGSVQLGMIEALFPKMENFSKNPSARRHYGWAAQSVRAALNYRLNAPQMPRNYAVGPFTYTKTGTAISGEDDRASDFRPYLASGTGTAGDYAHVTLINSPSIQYKFTGGSLLGTLRAFEVIVVLESNYSATSPARILVGVPDGTAVLNGPGFGADITTTTIKLLTHDGTTLTETPISWTPRFQSTFRFIRYLNFVRLEVNGVPLLTHQIPFNSTNATWRSVAVVAERVSGATLEVQCTPPTFRFLD